MFGRLTIWALAVLLASALFLSCQKKTSSVENEQGHPGADLVSGGCVMTSINHWLVLTTGQSPGGNGVMTSASYRLHGGLVGSTQ